MGHISAARQSAATMLKDSREIRNQCNKTWNIANKAPMYTRISKPKDGSKGAKTGKKVVRTKRLINNHAYKIAASGAAAYTSSVLKREGDTFRVSTTPESKRCPWLPSINKGAISVLEAFLCAYAQEATRNAVSIRKGLIGSKRLNGKLMKIGYERADAAIFGGSMPAPRTVIIAKPEKKSKKGDEKKEDGDYNPPEAEAE